MPTIFQKFPTIKNPLEKVLVYPVAVQFLALLTGAAFVFPKVREFAFTGNSGEIFVLDGVTMAANIDQLNFSQAIDPAYNNGFFSLDVVRAGNGTTVGLAPFRFSAFNQGAEFSVNWRPTATENNEEKFLFQLDGSLLQTPELITLGVTQVQISISANIYRIKTTMEG